jgi:hypothetical protein
VLQNRNNFPLTKRPDFCKESSWLSSTIYWDKEGRCMQLRKVSPLKRALLYTVVFSLSFIFAWQVTVHAATTETFGDNTGNTFPGTLEDALMLQGSFYNYGGAETIPVGEGADLGEASRSLIRFMNIANYLPNDAVITSATMYLYCSLEDSDADHRVSAYRVLKDWGEGDGDGAWLFDVVNWDYAQYYNLPWNTAGCGVANDGTGEDSTADRRATAEAGTLITGTGWFVWNLTAAVQNWYSGDWSKYGVILINDDEDTPNCRKVFQSSEGTNGQRPYLSVTYDVGTPGTDTDSAHGDDASGVFRRPVSEDWPLGVDCTQWPGETCDNTKGSCAHCHDTFNDNYCGVTTLMLFADLDYDSQWDSFCIECHQGPASSIQVSMPNQYTYSVTRGGAPTGCPANIRGAFRFVKEDGSQRTQCSSSVGSSHFLGDIRASLAGKWGFDSDPANINACHACHNPHLAKQDYPCSLPSDHNSVSGWEVWGDDPGEKMSDYATGGYYYNYYPPYLYPFPETVSPPYGEPPPQPREWTGDSAAPDYVTLCLECHQDPQYSTRLSRNLLAIDWSDGTTTDLHGKNGEPGKAESYGVKLNPYRSEYGYKVLMCTDCHDPHGSPNEFLLRTSVNGKDDLSVEGPGEWFDWCSSCHYFAGWHNSGLNCPDCHGHGQTTQFSSEGF